jgi:hypothetical protein
VVIHLAWIANASVLFYANWRGQLCGDGENGLNR